ncbi:nucleoside hydrolase [Mixta tenebrionis]|uniref:Nucleoside hydrolase n=1 Tax=Mixta tenebrionis TaxID=2562439 RepID=A0A506VAE0_9GAMM|nr:MULTISPECIES: nucleoside hydrolase [Mixta]QHM77326.1 Pyrimidine-specific ribonucleoside hydrolase RihB [Mixta theicola]TPW41953.1 nucleoside hydrolase [Mixta tenebrionis]
MHDIILDTDIGVDDAFALAYAAKTQRLLGITTVFGNVAVEQAVKNARLFCHKMQIDAPILRGCSRALAQAPTPPATWIHGADGLGGVFSNHFSSEAENAVDFIIRSVNARPGEITLVAIGPLTNIASAINQAPEIAARVKQLVIMGGAFGTDGHAGNVTPFAEFNIWKDPHAADQVLTSALPIVLVPLDVTHQVLISGEAIRTLQQPVLEAISRSYLDYSRQKERFAGMALHDTLTISWLVNPGWFRTVRAPIRVISEGIASGQTQRQLTSLASRDNAFAGCPAQQICLGVDAAAAQAHFLQTLRRQAA